MANQLVYILKENIEPYLNSITLLENQFTLRVITKDKYADTISADLSLSKECKDISFTIFISKSNYFAAETRYYILEKTVAAGIIAEPVFIVVSDEFS